MKVNHIKSVALVKEKDHVGFTRLEIVTNDKKLDKENRGERNLESSWLIPCKNYT